MDAGSQDRLDAGQLFRLHAKFIARFLARLGVGAPDVEDAVQEVFLVAHRKGGYTQGPAKARTWLGEIGLRVASTTQRAERRRLRRMADAAERVVVATAPPPDGDAERSEALRRVDAVLATMDVDQRAVFVLFEIEGEPCDDIAAALAVPVGTVYSRLHAARQTFLAAYGRREAQERALLTGPAKKRGP